MNSIDYGRQRFCFRKGSIALISTLVVERALGGEDVTAFNKRLMEKYSTEEGTIEVVFKAGNPDYAVITIMHDT